MIPAGGATGKAVARLLPALILLLAGSAPPPAAGAQGDPAPFVLGPDGRVYRFQAWEPTLAPLPSPLARIAGKPVNDLTVSEDGRRMVVLPVSPAGTGSRKHEGTAVIVALDGETAPQIVAEIPFDGDGRRVAVSRDGSRAYVLAIRAGASDPAGGTLKSWLHLLDLEQGTILSSAPLDRPPGAIALDEADGRLFLSYSGRIVTYTTHPLARSWHYRSPGGNRGLGFLPQSEILGVVRGNEVALFDPAVIARRTPEERQKLVDDATSVVTLPFAADSLFSTGGQGMAAVFGSGRDVGFLDSVAVRIVVPSLETGTLAGPEIRPIGFGAGGELLVAEFPGGRVAKIQVPEATAPPQPPPAALPSPTPLPAPVVPPPPTPPDSPVDAPLAPPSPVPAAPPAVPPPPAIPSPTPSPLPSPQPRDEERPGIGGRLSGRIELVRGIVLLGPGSIVHEAARSTPSADGTWSLPLPAPGVYRVLPVGEGARPIHCEPNFRTLSIRGEGVRDLDFNILGGG